MRYLWQMDSCGTTSFLLAAATTTAATAATATTEATEGHKEATRASKTGSKTHFQTQ
jgi:hypothetical protein